MLAQVDVGLIGEIIGHGIEGVLVVVVYGMWRYHNKQMARRDDEIDEYRTSLKEEQLNFVAMLREQLTSYGKIIGKMSSLPDDVSTKVVENIQNMQKELHRRIEDLPKNNLEKIEPVIDRQTSMIKEAISKAS
jgi:glutamyl-tRNA reductase